MLRKNVKKQYSSSSSSNLIYNAHILSRKSRIGGAGSRQVETDAVCCWVAKGLRKWNLSRRLNVAVSWNNGASSLGLYAADTAKPLVHYQHADGVCNVPKRYNTDVEYETETWFHRSTDWIAYHVMMTMMIWWWWYCMTRITLKHHITSDVTWSR